MATRQVGIPVNAPGLPYPQFDFGVPHVDSGPVSFGVLGTFPPTRCGLATFSAALSDGLCANGAEVGVVQVADGAPASDPRVAGQLVNGSPPSIAECVNLLNERGVAIIQHDYGIYGGTDGDELVDIVEGLRVPSIVVAHAILKNPSAHQRSVFEAIAAATDQIVVMSATARQRLDTGFDIDHRKITTIPHGATVPTRIGPSVRFGRPTMLTWGLLGPGKGVERVVEVMGSLRDLPGRPRYLIVGRTHPKVLAGSGEAYREAVAAQAQRIGVADSVAFDPNYHGAASLTALVQSAAVIVLPYDSTDQVTSGVLVDAIASGRPVVATAFPHAVELLEGGAGIVVDHDSPDALASALRRVLTEPRLAGAMAAEARRLAPTMAWSVVARAYLGLARRLVADRRALI